MTTQTASDELARACAQALIARDQTARLLAIELGEAKPGFARLTMTVDATMINGHDIAHGGIIFTLADMAFACACNSRDVPHVALDATISFCAPAMLGDRLEAVAVERSLGGRTGTYDVTITSANGTLVSVFRGTCYRVRGTVVRE